LAGFDVVKSGAKMIMPVYVPLVSSFLNAIVANLWPFSRLGIFHYVVLRKPEKRHVSSKPSMSIIVPARNEAGTIERIVKELPEVGAFTEIIFVEGNSTDSTYDEIVRVADVYGKEKRIQYAKHDVRGKGSAVRRGFDMAKGDILTIYDADMTVPPEEMRKFYDAIVENKGDFINGSRLVYPLEKDSMRVLNFFGNKFFSLAFSWILGQPLKDTLCGTKVIWREDYEKVKEGRAFFGDFDPFGDFDLLFGAAKLNLKIVDLPIHYKERVYGSTNISRWKHGWLLLKMTVFAARKMKFI
jgi:glycosyltransferase involved in cell wall biosynthesis